MFPQQPLQQFRTTNADVQLFYRDSTWSKPPGVSHVYMMLIGGGGNGDGTNGGGSGTVTFWFGAAQYVPDNLVVLVSTGDASDTTVNYRGTNGLNALLTAYAANASVGGPAMVVNTFTASGFFRSTGGVAGSATTQSPAGTFLTGGTNTAAINANYGYSLPVGNKDGLFFLQPIIVGLGAGSSGAASGGIGCGGSAAIGGKGGAGLVIIASR